MVGALVCKGETVVDLRTSGRMVEEANWVDRKTLRIEVGPLLQKACILSRIPPVPAAQNGINALRTVTEKVSTRK